MIKHNTEIKLSCNVMCQFAVHAVGDCNLKNTECTFSTLGKQRLALGVS